MDLKTLRDRNVARQAVWPGAENVDLAFRGLELGGEAGELQNLLKKLVRLKRGIKGQTGEERANQYHDLRFAIADELADVVICVDLIAMDLNIPLGRAIRAKFNKTSKKNDIDVLF